MFTFVRSRRSVLYNVCRSYSTLKLNTRLCLVTSRELAAGRSLEEVVEHSLNSGATMVQLREKETETRHFLRIAQSLKQITEKWQVPLIINDRVDIALAINASGVHVGQSDMPAAVARKLLGNDKIIGVTVGSVEEAAQAFCDGADYLGTDAIYPTTTKRNTNVIGIEKFRQICESTSLPVMGIGGVTAEKVREVIRAGAQGVAVVSAICSAPDVAAATACIKNEVVKALPCYSAELADFAANTLKKVRTTKPLIQHLTNYVVMNDTANVTLQVGARPVMAHENSEMTATAKALVINIGTLDQTWVATFHQIGGVASEANVPIILDPVGAGATKFRMEVSQNLLKSLKITVLKGNPGEIGTLAGAKTTMSGVDSISRPEKAHQLVQELAKSRNIVVAMTGKYDIISDGTHTLEVHNNHQLLQSLTGTGCSASAVIGAFVAAEREKPLEATASALAFFCYAAEVAGARAQMKGPGTFREELLNTLFCVSPEEFRSNAKIVFVEN